MKKSFKKNNISVGLGNSCSGNGHGAGQSRSQRRSRLCKRIHLAWPGFGGVSIQPRCQFLTKGSHCLHGEQQVSKKKIQKRLTSH